MRLPGFHLMESTPRVVAFIQARMTSRRFPGKSLAPFRGKPLLDHVVEGVRHVVPDVVVLTSEQLSDDPIASHAHSRGFSCFRGSLDDVLGRFQAAANRWDVTWILRVCADSPLINEPMLRAVLKAADDTADLVTTTHQRTLPIGQNAELIRRSTLLSLPSELTADDREHVTRFIHRSPARFRIVNLTSKRDWSKTDLSVDTVEGLQRLEAMTDVEIDRHRHEELL